MPISIRYTAGSSAGQTLEFGAEVQEIYIGRDARTCQFVLPPEATQVSAEHCSLVRVPGGYRLRLNRGNVVLVDGDPAHDDQDLGALHELTLGRRGPVIIVETQGDSGLKPTRKQNDRQASPHTAVRAVEARVSRTRQMVLITVGLILLLLVGGIAGFKIASARATSAAEEAQVASQRVRDLTVDMLKAREESRAMFQPVVKRISESVYLVARRLDSDGKGALQPFGTAWVVAPGKLATNAHIADEFGSLKTGQSIVVLGPAGQELRIRTVRLHPGYERFPKVVAEHRVFDAPGGYLLNGLDLRACDVAVMFVEDEDASKLGPPLEMASDEEASKLEQGAALAYLGYPQEGLVKGGVSLRKPQATFQEGVLTGATGFFQQRTDARENYLVHFSMTVAGGASGSPVFNREGKVVAVLCAGNFMHLEDQPRVPLGGVSYGQRIDLLRELQGKSTKTEILSRHEPGWNAELDKLFELGTGGLLVALENKLAVEAGADLVKLKSESGTIAKPGIDSAARVRITAPETGHYVGIVVADRNVPIESHVLRGTKVVSDGEGDAYYSVLRFEAQKGEALDLLVGVSTSDDSRNVPFRLQVSRVAP